MNYNPCPKNYRAYLSAHDRALWRTAMELKMDKYLAANLWTEVDPATVPAGTKCLGSLWAFALKYDADNRCTRNPRFCVIREDAEGEATAIQSVWDLHLPNGDIIGPSEEVLRSLNAGDPGPMELWKLEHPWAAANEPPVDGEAKPQPGMAELCGTVRTATIKAEDVAVEDLREKSVVQPAELSRSQRTVLLRDEKRGQQLARAHLQVRGKRDQSRRRLHWLSSTLIRMDSGTERGAHVDPGVEDLVVMRTLAGQAQLTFSRKTRQSIVIALDAGTTVVMSRTARWG